jgi:chemotaxis protein methyltransferase CheR
MMSTPLITDREFAQFQRFIFDIAGISLSDAKKNLVSGRLAKRLAHHGMDSYGAYFSVLANGSDQAETQIAVDLLTTNETYFFRESKHFDLLREVAVETRKQGRALRVWSAACSSGEECYSMAMVLADVLDDRWEVLGTDISARVLARARLGHYPMERASHIPTAYLKRFCLKGHGPQAGTLLVERSLRQRVQFLPMNLNAALPSIGMFDVIFLRNVMIYFNVDTKRTVVARVLKHLHPGGHFVIGHSESLNTISDAVVALAPSMYRKQPG